MTEMYKQCKFQKNDLDDNAVLYTTGWIEEHGAKVGNRVELLSADGEFWTVVSVSEQALPKESIRANERNFKEFQKSLRGGGIDQ